MNASQTPEQQQPQPPYPAPQYGAPQYGVPPISAASPQAAQSRGKLWLIILIIDIVLFGCLVGGVAWVISYSWAHTEISTNFPIEAGTEYVNDAIGMSIVLAPGWEAYESERYPDEVLTIFPEDLLDETVIWIDRYPTLTANAILRDSKTFLPRYTTSDNTNAKYQIIEQSEITEIENGSQAWYKIDLVTECDNDLCSVSLYFTDMPSNRGVFIYAILTPADSRGNFPTDDLKPFEAMFETIKFPQQTAALTPHPQIAA